MCKLSKNKRKILILDIIIILCWMATVFTFSNQIGKASTGLSSSIASKLVDIIHKEPEFTAKEKKQLISKYNYRIRKLAHYSIFLVGGIVIISFVNSLSTKKWKSSIITIILGFLYAGSDEIHQYFVSGRDARFKDVLIDTAGVISGVLIYLIILKISEKWKQKRNKVNINVDAKDKAKECM